MDEAKISFGGKTLGCKDCQVTSAINSMPFAVLKINKQEFLALGSINYLVEVVVTFAGWKKPAFTGHVANIKKLPSNLLELRLEGGVELTDSYTSGLVVIKVSPQEVFYSMARTAGIPSNRLVVEGLDTSMKNLMAFVPFSGLVVDKETTVGDVRFLDIKSLRSKLPDSEDVQLWTDFFNADGWISFQIEAQHFAEAEQAAIEKADAFFAVYSGSLQYGYSQFGNELVEWDRQREQINLRRADQVLLVMLSGGSAWLRNLEPHKPTQAKLQPSVSVNMAAIVSADENLQLPLLVWSRFRASDDYYVVTVGMWQVFELLCSNVKLPKRVSKEGLADIRKRLDNSLTDVQKKVMEPLLEQANFRALGEKLDKHLEDINLTLSEEDKLLLSKFRKIRNFIEHGQKATEPSTHDLKQVKALVNRIILTTLNERTKV